MSLTSLAVIHMAYGSNIHGLCFCYDFLEDSDESLQAEQIALVGPLMAAIVAPGHAAVGGGLVGGVSKVYGLDIEGRRAVPGEGEAGAVVDNEERARVEARGNLLGEAVVEATQSVVDGQRQLTPYFSAVVQEILDGVSELVVRQEQPVKLVQSLKLPVGGVKFLRKQESNSEWED